MKELIFKKGSINDKIIELVDDKYIFTRDYTFNSILTAGSVILGRSTNGLKMWKDKTGKTLDRIFRKNSEHTKYLF
jgi:hypothetical protein